MAVTFTPRHAFRSAGPEGKTLRVIRGTLVVTDSAADETDLTADLFGLRRLIRVSNLVNDDNDLLIAAGVTSDDSAIFVTEYQEDNGDIVIEPTLAVGTYHITVEGQL